jgi:anti-sigma regulatory factor (Ser/Thr protein kinase)
MMQTISIRNDTDVARAVAMTTLTARKAGLDAMQVNAVSTATSELARNIVKYAGTGNVAVSRVDEDGVAGVRVVASDRGPGIDDVESALRDHYSTGGTLGLGLPGVNRLMDDLKIDSTRGRGTRVTATLWARDHKRARRTTNRVPTSFRLRPASTVKLEPSPNGAGGVAAAARIRPHRTERVSGDAVTLRWIGDRVLAALVDGLGHGATAAAIAERAGSALGSTQATDVLTIMEEVHKALRSTDGAAVAIAVLDPRQGSYETVAVGNARVRIVGDSDRRLDWTEGTVGTEYRTPDVKRGLLGDATLLLYSDGIADHFEARDYPGIRSDSPSTAARIIMERFGKDHDDASCVVLRRSP